MMLRTRLLSLLLLSYFVAGAEAADNKPVVVTDLHIHDLKWGVNVVPRFAKDGRSARIVQAWRGNGNAHGYDVFMVMMPGGETDSDWNVVGFDTGREFRDSIRDDPHTGEDMNGSVYFGNALLNGKREAVVLTATQQIRGSYGEPAFTRFEIYKLVREDGFGTTDQFELVDTILSKTKTCNADLAFSRQFHVALPKSYAGPNAKDGCP